MLVMGIPAIWEGVRFYGTGDGRAFRDKGAARALSFFSLFNDDDGDDDGGGDDAGKYYLLQMRRIRFLGALQVDLLYLYCPALPWDFYRSSFLFLLLVRARCPLFLSSLHDLSQ